MANLDSLYGEDQRQQAFVDHQGGVLVALAGPGTGKTYSFLLRIKELTEERNVDSETICYLTFNREIARAFKDDLLLKYPGAVPPQRIWASTLHSLACRLIRNRGHRIQLDGHLCILNLCDSKDPIARIAASDIRSVLPQGSTIRDARTMQASLWTIKTERQRGQPVGNRTGDDALVEQTYQAYSRALKLLDWDEVIPLAISLYPSEENDRPSWIRKYQHLLIDEFQDFNVAEQIFLRSIVESVVSCAMVGDDDQSIYRARGASPNGIRGLVRDPDVNTISLVQCWRCHEEIVQSANRFLSFMHPNPRQLRAIKPGGVVAIKSFRSAAAEVDYLVEYIRDILSQIHRDTSPDDGVVCLFPMHKVLQQYRKEFERRGLKCKCRDSSDLLDDKMWVRILGTLAFQRNQPFLERLILEVFPAVRPRLKKEVVAALVDGHASVSSALASIERSHDRPQPVSAAISEYNTFLQCLTSRDSTRVASCIDSVLPSGRRCNPYYVDEFLATADETTLEESLDVLMDRIYGDGDEEGAQGEFEPAVEFLTLHSSKGLTRRYVILPGLEHCWLPGDATGADLDERKRLFLVGITRATEFLLITYPRTRAPRDSLNYPAAGRHQLSEFANRLGVAVERL
jgi:DNA helicase-2/ATP-dependent DNA helicase PcrA